MRARSLLIVLALVATPALAGETARYIVRTLGSPGPSALPFGIPDAADRGYHDFASVDAFVAVLSEEEAEVLRRHPRVRGIEVDAERYLAGIETMGFPRVGETTPWGVDFVHAPQVWPLAMGRGIRVGVMDTGIDPSHPDLPNYRGGYDFFNNDDSPSDGNGHGTHMAGTIGAARNGFGTVGVAPEVDLFAIKLISDNGAILRSSDVMRGLDWAIANGMNVLNCSFTGPVEVEAEKEAFQRAADSGILIFAAAGNGSGYVGYPAGYDSVSAVTAITSSYTFAAFSSFGAKLDFSSPGDSVFSSILPGTATIAAVAMADGSVVPATPVGRFPKGEKKGTLLDVGFGFPQDFPSTANGSVVLMKLGEITIWDKLHNAEMAGAAGIIYYDEISGSSCNAASSSDLGGHFVLCVSRSAGRELKTKVGQQATIGVYADDYASFAGTSSATAFVSGVAALVWSVVPAATSNEILQAMRASALDLGLPGHDHRFGFGLVDAFRAARILAPEKFPAPVRRRPVRP
jgi:subtilisin family serine protease